MVTVSIVGEPPLIKEALEALIERMPGFSWVNEGEQEISIDLVLLAFTEPASLLEEISNLRKQYPETGLVCLQREWTAPLAVQALQAGANGCLDTDLDSVTLAAALRQAARGEVSLPAVLQQAVIFELLGEAPSRSGPDPYSLSPREKDVLALLCQGLSNKQIAQHLYLSVRTVENHLARLYEKLGVQTRTEAAVLALQQGWELRD